MEAANSRRELIQAGARVESARGGRSDQAQVARQGYEALIAGDERVVGGSLKNRFQVAASKARRDSKKAEMHRSMAEPVTGEGED